VDRAEVSAGRYDAVIVGAGHNGLVAASYLSDAGLRVLVAERRSLVGGACVTEELIPGTRSSSCAFVAAPGLHPKVIRDLRLHRLGLRLYQTDVSTCIVHEPGASRIVLWAEMGRTLRELCERFGAPEASGLIHLGARLRRFATLMQRFLLNSPPSLEQLNRHFARNPDLLREFTETSVGELVGRYLASEELQGALAFLGLTGTHGGPRTPGTSMVLAYHSWGEFEGGFGEPAFARGGMGAIAESLATAARLRGATIRTDAPVNAILVEDGSAAGVTLEGGAEISAPLVIANADPRHTFLDLVDSDQLAPEFVASVRGLDFRGSMARVHVAVEELPTLIGPGPGSEHRGLTLLGSTMGRLERCAEKQAERALASELPLPLEFLTQSAHDPELGGRRPHVLVTGVQQLPFELAEGTWDDRAEELTDRVLDSLCMFMPSLRDRVIATHTITPLDLERTYGLTGGNIFHGAMSLDQSFDRRPVAGFGDYRTPVDGLYLCGSGTHPGGAVTGMPGHNAASQVLTDLDCALRLAARRRARLSARQIRRTAFDRLLERKRVRRAAVAASRHPRVWRALERIGR
jgi:phytoene dehydrogenase-like protein